MGERLVVNCYVSAGDSPIELRWLKDSRPIVPDAERKHVSTTRGDFDLSLKINPVSFHNSGEYTCSATNRFGEARRTAKLVVRGKPSLFSHLKMHIYSKQCMHESFAGMSTLHLHKISQLIACMFTKRFEVYAWSLIQLLTYFFSMREPSERVNHIKVILRQIGFPKEGLPRDLDKEPHKSAD